MMWYTINVRSEKLAVHFVDALSYYKNPSFTILTMTLKKGHKTKMTLQ